MTTAPRILLAVTLLAAAACASGRSDRAADVLSPPTPGASAREVHAASGAEATSTTITDVVTASTHHAGTIPRPAQTTTAVQPPDPEPGAGTPDPEGSSRYAPPPGRYVYDMTGTITTSDVTGTNEEPVPASSVDDISVTDDGAGTVRMMVTTRDEGRDSIQELEIGVDEGGAHLARLRRRPDAGVGITVNPDPPALLARFPYTTHHRWEIAWNDPGSGTSGVGTGTVEPRETISTPAGTFETVVVTVVQRLRGTITGTFTVTSWIDPTTGIHAKQHTVADLRGGTGASRSDTTRILRERPA